jgi:hypothetical protein
MPRCDLGKGVSAGDALTLPRAHRPAALRHALPRSCGRQRALSALPACRLRCRRCPAALPGPQQVAKLVQVEVQLASGGH